MRVRNLLSKERIVNSLKSLGKLRIKVSQSSVLTFSALALILFTAFTIRLFPLHWEIALGTDPVQLHLSEFDPYHQYRFTQRILNNGFAFWTWSDLNWVDSRSWYPQGVNMLKGAYPGLPLTAAFLYSIISSLGVNIRLMDFCAIFPAVMAVLACLVIYFLGKDIGGKPVGLFAALFLALSPSYIQRTQVGFFDDETVGVFAFLLFILLFLRAIERDRPLNSSMKYALASGIVIGYFCSGWGAAYYAIGLTVFFAFLLILLKRYTQRLLLSYSLAFGLGLFIAISVPKLSPTYLTTNVILPVAGVFVLLCLCEVFRVLASTKWRIVSLVILLAMLLGGFSILWQFGYMRGIGGKFFSVINPFARGAAPLIESVAEHRISAWGPIYYDLGIVVIFFLAGFFFVLRDLNDKNLFLLLFGLTSLYFACSMVRLLVVLAPAFGLLAAVGITRILKPFNTLLKEPPKINVKKKYGLQHVGKEFSGAAVFLIFLILMTNFAFPTPKVYQQVSTPVTISAGSLPITPDKPVHEWLDMLDWMQSNLKATTVVCSWWDYGYWLTIMGNVTTLADNGTINSTQIRNIGFTFIANETQALKMLKLYNVTYILVFTTLALRQSGEKQYSAVWAGFGDEGKWTWMATISGQGNWTKLEDKGFIDKPSEWTSELSDVRKIFGNYSLGVDGMDTDGDGRIDKTADNLRGQNTLIYKLMSWGAHAWCSKHGVTDPSKAIQPEYFNEAYFAGVEGSGYGGIIPLVCLYKINWQKYYSDYPSG